MELHQLRYFVAVAEDLNATRAAARIHVTQQAISKAVAALERELGVELLLRRPRGCSLTADGHVFLRDAVEILERTDRARRLRRESASAADRLRVTVVGPEGVDELDAFAADHPQHDVQVHHADSVQDILVPLLSGDVDAVVSVSRFDGDVGVDVDVVGTRPRAALVPASSPYADADALTTDDLLDARFGPRHPLEPLHWESDWALVPERGEQPRRASFDLADHFEDQIRQVAEEGCVVTMATSLAEMSAAWSSGRMVVVPMPAARPVEITLSTVRSSGPLADLRRALQGG